MPGEIQAQSIVGNEEAVQAPRAQAIDLHQLYAAAYRSRFALVCILAAAILLGLITILLTPKEYTAVATVQIDQEAAKVLGTEETELSASIQDAERFLQTQVDVIASRATAIEVANDLGLFRDSSFLVSMNVDPDAAKTGPSITPDQSRRELVLETISENLIISLPLDSRIVQISFSSPDPKLAARVANSFSTNFIKSNLRRKFDASLYAREFLAGELQTVRQRLEKSERAALTFAERTQIVDTSSASESEDGQKGPRSLTTATLVKINQDYAAALSRRIAAERKWDQARTMSVMTIPDVLANQAIQELTQSRAALNAEYQEQLESRKAEYPAVAQLRAKISELDRQIATLASNIRNSIRTDYQVANAQSLALERQVNLLKSDTLREQSQAVQIAILRRETETNRQQYEALLRRFNQLTAEAGLQSNNIMVVDEAVTPVEPTWPKIPIIIAVWLVVGLAASAVYIFVQEFVFSKVRTPDEAEAVTSLPLLSTVPDAGDAVDVMQILQDPKSDLSEALSSLRTSLLLSSTRGFPKSLSFTSTQPGEGKSTICAGLAIRLAKQGSRVLVIDLDLRRASQHKVFGLENRQGASTALARLSEWHALVKQTEVDNVDVLTAGPLPPNPIELLSDDSLRGLIEGAGDQYDHVLVDGVPVLGLADALLISRAVEATVYVVESGRNSPRAVRSSIARLARGNVRLAGAILSRFNPQDTGYGYSYANYEYDYKS